MIPFLLAIAVFGSDWQPPAEPEGVSVIREHYTELKASIAADDWSDGLYRTEIVVNAGNAPFPALGDYFVTITLYWTSAAGRSDLVMAVRSGTYAAHSEYEELMWDDSGDLQFRFLAWDNGTGSREEVRRWYSHGSGIHATACTVTDEGTEYRPPSDDDFDVEPGWYEELFGLCH